MKKWLNYLPTIFILSIVLSLVFYSSQGSTVQMNYTQFEKIVDEVDFKKSSMTISSTVIQLEGTYEQNSKTIGYKVIVPRTEKNIEKLEKDLQRNGGKLTVEDPNQGSVWISILSQIIPFLIIAVFFQYSIKIKAIGPIPQPRSNVLSGSASLSSTVSKRIRVPSSNLSLLKTPAFEFNLYVKSRKCIVISSGASFTISFVK